MAMTRELAAVTLVLPLVLGSGAGVRAAGPAQDCSEIENQSAMNACYMQQYNASDAALTAVYDKLMGKLAAADKARLRDAERAWIAFRDKECAFETAESEGGSVHSTMLSICLQRITDGRTKELKDQAECQEGDLACAR